MNREVSLIGVEDTLQVRGNRHMIFYYSGTGNSLWVAKELGKYQNEMLIDIAREMQKNQEEYVYDLGRKEKIGFVFPTYSWAPPQIVENFIKKVKFNGYRQHYLFSVYTCGTDTGCMSKYLDNMFKDKKMEIYYTTFIKMPENFITMFDLDSTLLRNRKLEEAQKSIVRINEQIKDRQLHAFDKDKYTIMDYFKTYIVKRLFYICCMGTSKFNVDSKCNSCGLWVKVCPYKNIELYKGRPMWSQHCTKCMACICRCPQEAIQYGKGTRKKGRYYNPLLKQENENSEQV